MTKRWNVMKIVVITILCIELLIGIFMIKYDYDRRHYSPEIHTVENFYKEPYLENYDVIRSIFNNYGTFEFKTFKDSFSDVEMVERYFNIDIKHNGFLIDYDLSIDEENVDSDIPSLEPYRLTAVIHAPVEYIDEMFGLKHHISVDPRVEDFEKYFPDNKYNVELEKSLINLEHVYFEYAKQKHISCYRYTYGFISKPKDGKQYVFLTINALGLTRYDYWMKY